MGDAWRAAMAQRAKAWAYGFLSADEGPSPAQKQAVTASVAQDLPDLSPKEREEYAASHAYPYLSWSELEHVDLSPLQEDWTALVGTYGDEPVYLAASTPAPADWWKPALRLMITADTASTGIGFKARGWHAPSSGRSVGTIPNWVQGTFFGDIRDSQVGKDAFRTTVTTAAFDGALAAVLPKTRTSSLGVTLRSLSHNLALLPSPGLVEARWRAPGVRPLAAVRRPGAVDICKPLNLLLVPFPYRILPKSFVPDIGHPVPPGDWGYFHLQQTWLRKDGRVDLYDGSVDDRRADSSTLKHFVESLVERGRRELGEINGVVFPEGALDSLTFNDIAQTLREKAGDTGFEFIVAGLSEEISSNGGEEAHTGNYAAFRGLTRRASDGKLTTPNQWA